MTDFVGDDHSVALQKSLAARADLIAANPLLANGGRVLNILDPDRYGWDNVRADVDRDSFIALTMVDRERTLSKLEEVFGPDQSFPYWEAFTGTPEDVLPACAKIVSEINLPEGWSISSETHPDANTVHDAQVLNRETGVAPTPEYFLQGDLIPSILTSMRDENGALAACASATMRYHPQGPLAEWLFAGAVSVGPTYRRMGLGSLVNAKLLVDSHDAHSWIGVLEQAKADNAASVGMIQRCGLHRVPGKATIVVNPSGRYLTR